MTVSTLLLITGPMTRPAMRLAILACLFLQLSTSVLAAGNYPESGSCPKDRPYYAICTHSLHSLEGWYSRECHADKAAAQQDAEAHARSYHQGNMRWTGIHQPR